tara:strand:- start:606 stop:1514 length:909 start_codon:yes stop_codon:yes gene_type:complete
MSELVTINTENYATMAKAMGLPISSSSKKSNSLNRFRVWHSPILNDESVLVKGGMYRLEVVGDTPTYYFAEKAKFRPFVQRLLYKRFVKNSSAKAGDKQGDYIKTIMADTLNIDLKDEAGTFNCGKPTGYVEDYQSLPEDTKNLIKATKRNRAVFGTVELINPVKAIDGEQVKDLGKFHALWEIDNKDAFKSMGATFSKFAKMESLPLQYIINLDGTTGHKANNGQKWYTPNISLVTTEKIEISDEDHKTFGDFLDWIKIYNDGVVSRWDESVAQRQDEISDEDADTVEQFIDVELEANEKQ